MTAGIIMATVAFLLAAVIVAGPMPDYAALCRLRARVLLCAAMAPGNAGRPRQRLWARAQEARRHADALDGAARCRARLRARVRAMRTGGEPINTRRRA